MNSGDDANDRMLTFFTGRTEKERISKERAIKFPLKLMYALECGDYNHIITWSVVDGGISFLIFDTSAFAKHVLPALFKVAKFDSFQRKLYRWGFVKERTRASINTMMSFSHPSFRKSDFALASKMTCSGPGSAANRMTSMFAAPPSAVSDSSAGTDLVAGATNSNTANTVGGYQQDNFPPIFRVDGARDTLSTLLGQEYYHTANDSRFGLRRDPLQMPMLANAGGMKSSSGVFGRLSSESIIPPRFYQTTPGACYHHDSDQHHGGSQTSTSRRTGIDSSQQMMRSLTNPFQQLRTSGMDSLHQHHLSTQLRRISTIPPPQQQKEMRNSSPSGPMLSMMEQQSIIQDALDVLQRGA